jgi:hypothetical protein
VGARAAHLLALLASVVDCVQHLDERWCVDGSHGSGCGRNGGLEVLGTAGAARGVLQWGFAGGFLALELALGLRAVGGLCALVGAGKLLANRLALGFWGSAGGVADGGLADRLALGASILLALLLGAADRANGLLAMNGALGAGSLLALHLALGSLADGVADGGALWVITLPFAVGVAHLGRRQCSERKDCKNDECSHNNCEIFKGSQGKLS